MVLKLTNTSRKNEIKLPMSSMTLIILCNENDSRSVTQISNTIPKKIPTLFHVPSMVDVISPNILNPRKLLPKIKRSKRKRLRRIDEDKNASWPTNRRCFSLKSDAIRKRYTNPRSTKPTVLWSKEMPRNVIRENPFAIPAKKYISGTTINREKFFHPDCNDGIEPVKKIDMIYKSSARITLHENRRLVPYCTEIKETGIKKMGIRNVTNTNKL